MSIETYGLQDLIDMIAVAYASQALKKANVGRGSQFGPAFRAVALVQLLQQNETLYVQTMARLRTMPDPLPDGTPNPDVDSFINAFGFERPGPAPGQGYLTWDIPAPLGVDTIIPIGYVIGSGAGPTFIVAPNGAGYNAEAGGYVISAGQTTTQVFVTCSVNGSIGNAQPNTVTQIIAGPNNAPPNPTFSATNAALFEGGLDATTGGPLYDLFAEYISGGGAGTPNAILAGVGLSMAGLTYSYGDFVMAVKSGSNWTFTPNTASWFTVCADIAGAPGTITQAQLDAIRAAILFAVRPAGIYFAVAPPTPLAVAGSGTVVCVPGADPTATTALVNAAYAAYINGLGLDPYGNPMVASLQGVNVALAPQSPQIPNGIPGLLRIDGLTLNGNAADVTANFGLILVAGTLGFHP